MQRHKHGGEQKILNKQYYGETNYAKDGTFNSFKIL